MDQPVPPTPHTEALISHAASEATKAGALTTGFGWLTSNAIIALLGLLVAIMGFCVNLYFQRRRDDREAQLHDAKMKLFVVSTSGTGTPKELPAQASTEVSKAAQTAALTD